MHRITTAISRWPRQWVTAYVLTAAAVFILNSGHDAQQGIYRLSLESAQAWLDSGSYVISAENPTLRFYPLWGYPGVIAVFLAVGLTARPAIMGVQFILCLAAIGAAYRMSGREARWWHVPVFIPWMTFCSVAWADAWAGAAMVAAIWLMWRGERNRVIRDAVFAGAAIGIGAQFRTEIILWPAMLLLLAAFRWWRFREKRDLRRLTAMAVVAGMFLVPWAIRSGRSGIQNAPWIGSSNGGAVMFISLGQSPSNPWGIRNDDEYARQFAEIHGIDDPWSPKANTLMLNAATDSLLTRPFSALLKITWNMVRCVLGGMYAGEWPALVLNDEEWSEQQRLATAGQVGVLVKRGGFWTTALWILQAVMKAGSVLLLLALLIQFIRTPGLPPRLGAEGGLAIVALVVTKVLIIGFSQYESRHMSSLLIPLIVWAGINSRLGKPDSSR